MPGIPRDPLAAFRDLLPRITALLTVVSLIAAIFGGLGSPDDPGTGRPGPGDGAGEEPADDYRQPPPEIQEQLAVLQSDLMQAVLELRHAEPGVDPVAPASGLQIDAQHWAERNAVLGQEDSSPANVAMVQANLPLEQASGHAVLDQWLVSEAHTAVLLDPSHSWRGVGVAHGHGRVWAVLQFSA